MSQGANVEDLDVFRYMKAALIKFRQTAEIAMVNADAQISRTLHWLEGEQITYWQNQIRKRQEMVARCKEAIRQKQIFKDASGRTPSTFQEEKQLQAAMRALEEAEVKLASTKRYIPILQKEIEAYRGGVQSLGGVLTTEIPKAIAMLERLSQSLDEYVNLASSAAGPPGETGDRTLPPGQMQRGGESADEAQPGDQQESKGEEDVAG